MLVDEYDDVPPSASAMIESLRAFGYSPGAAVADLIDNSISAGAKRIWLTCHWAGPDSYVSIRDDGGGMSEDELRTAMRLGSMNPRVERAAGDLGRFGMGLKTASFSQCRRLTVASRVADGAIHVRRWDLDYIARASADRWALLRTPARGSEGLLSKLTGQSSGTVVLWEVLDRLSGQSVADNPKHRDAFYAVVESIRTHLGMVFHRYLDAARPPLRIHMNRDDDIGLVCPWDPFMEAHIATQAQPAEKVSSATGKFDVQGFVLPHKDRLTVGEYESGAGRLGWTSHQGLYVYRNQRLLIGGGWLGLGRPRRWTTQAEFSLARIRIDLPNWMDAEWQIDVKKSAARVPREARERVTELALMVRNKARSVFAHRGSYGRRRKSEQTLRVWGAKRMPDGRPYYRISRTHPTVRAALDGTLEKDGIEQLLAVIEATVPVQQIWLDTAESEGEHASLFDVIEDGLVRKMMKETYARYQARLGLTPEQAKQRLMQHEEFQDYVGILETIGE